MKKISHKLTILIILVLGLTLGSIWVYNSYFLEDFYLKSRIEILSKAGSDINNLYKASDSNALEEYIEKIQVEKNINSQISTISGELIYNSQPMMMMGRGHMNNRRVLTPAYLNRIISKGQAISTIKQGANETEMLAYSMVLGDREAIITLSLLLEPINKSIELMKTQLLYISIILFFVTLIIATFVARVFLKPIERLNYAVNQISQGNLDQRVEISTSDEIGDLSKNFNIMADKLKRLEVLRKELVSNVSHDLRTPLGIIKGYAEMIRDIHYKDYEKMDEDLKVIIEEADRLSLMVSEILDSSQFQSGYIELKKEEIDLVKLLRSSFEKYKLDADKKEIILTLNTNYQSLKIQADPIRLQQVVENLLSNALNFTNKGGKVNLNLFKTNDYIKVEVEDNGIGISEDEQGQIWERFYRVSKDEDDKKGSGIGLAITKNILIGHGFEYGLESKLGQGSKFFFIIPSKLS